MLRKRMAQQSNSTCRVCVLRAELAPSRIESNFQRAGLPRLWLVVALERAIANIVGLPGAWTVQSFLPTLWLSDMMALSSAFSVDAHAPRFLVLSEVFPIGYSLEYLHGPRSIFRSIPNVSCIRGIFRSRCWRSVAVRRPAVAMTRRHQGLTGRNSVVTRLEKQPKALQSAGQEHWH